jgi:hypothetical protein
MAENPTPGQPWVFRPDNAPAPSETTPGPAQPLAPVEAQAVTPQATAVPPTGADGSISWTASEFIAHQKTLGWYALLALVAIIVAASVFLLTKDKISTTVVIVAALAFGFYATRKPRQLEYRLDEYGLSIGPKYYNYDGMRGFTILPEGAFDSIVFTPLQRFGPLITIYYAPEDEEKIVSLLSARLPMEGREPDIIDRFMKRIRF